MRERRLEQDDFRMLPTVSCSGGDLVRGFFLALTLVGFASGQEDIVARVGDAAIRRQEVDLVLRRVGLGDLPAGPQRQRAAAAVLEQIIDERVLRAEVTAAGVVITEAEVETALARLREQVAGRGLEFADFLAQSGRTPESIRDQVALEIGLDKLVRPRITAEAVARVFEENRREFDGTRLRVSHIVLRPAAGGDGDLGDRLIEEAGAIRREIIQARLSFAEAARRHSAGPSRAVAGDLGWIGRQEPMVEAFTSEVFALSKGAVSEPFVTPFGVHLATVTAVEPGRIGLDAVRPKLEAMLATRLIRGLVSAGRGRMPVAFAPGVPHFDPATLGDPPARRPVIVSPPAD